MALGTRADLKAAVKLKLIRPGDTLIDSYLDDWIKLCEVGFNRKYFLRAMMKVASGVSLAHDSATPGRLLLPANFKALRSVKITSPTPISDVQPMLPEPFEQILADTSRTRRPEVVAIIGEEFNFWPLPDVTYTLQIAYWANIDSLSDATTTNWLLTNAPDVYLYGTLMQAAMDLEDAAGNLVKWTATYQAAIADLERADQFAIQPSSSGRVHFSDLPTLDSDRYRYNINTDGA